MHEQIKYPPFSRFAPVVFVSLTMLLLACQRCQAMVFIDVSQLLTTEAILTTANISKLVKPFTSLVSIDSWERGNIRLFYETDLVENQTSYEVKRMTNMIKNVFKDNRMLKPKVLLSIRYSGTKLTNLTVIYASQLLALLDGMEKTLDIFEGVSFENVDKSTVCSPSPIDRNEEKWWNMDKNKTFTNTNVMELILLAQQTKCEHMKKSASDCAVVNNIKLGYTLSMKNTSCVVPQSVVNHTDFLVMNMNVRHMYGLVETYGTFQDLLDKHFEVNRFERDDSFPKDVRVFWKLKLESRLEFGDINAYNDPDYFINLKILDPIFPLLQATEKEASSRYQALLTKYVFEWEKVWNSSQPSVIIAYSDRYVYGSEGHENSLKDSDWHLTPLNYVLAPHRLVENVASQVIFKRNTSIMDQKYNNTFAWNEIGFDTILLNGENFKQTKFLYSENSQCDEKLCKRRAASDWYTDALTLGNGTTTYTHNFSLESYVPLTLSSIWAPAGMEYDVHELNSIHRNCIITIKQNEGQNLSLYPVIFAAFDIANDFDICNPTTEKSSVVLINLEVKYLLSWNKIENGNMEMTAVQSGMLKMLAVTLIVREMMHHRGTKPIVRIKFFNVEKDDSIDLFSCHQPVTDMSPYHDVILNWARFHHVPLIIEPVDSPLYVDPPETWQPIPFIDHPVPIHKTLDADMALLFPVYIRRSFNQTPTFGAWTKDTYPCVSSFTTIPENKLKFNKEFSAATVNMYVRSTHLMENELKIILLFAFSTFHAVEIIPRNEQDLSTLSRVVMNDQFWGLVKRNRLSVSKAYLQVPNVPITKGVISSVKSVVTHLKRNSASPHLSIENLNAENLDGNLLNFLTTDGVPTGVVVPNCLELAKHLLFRIPQNATFFLIPKHVENLKTQYGITISYIICQTDTQQALWKSYEVNLNRHLYLQHVLQMMFPSVQVSFRLKPMLWGNFRSEKFDQLLLWLHNMNNYATLYKIPFFLLPALVHQDLSGVIASWWTVTNYTNLSNTFVYQEYQAAYLLSDPWRPNLLTDGNKEDSGTILQLSQGTIILMFLGFFVSLIIVGGGVFWIAKKLNIIQFLSREEAREFKEGHHATLDDVSNGSHYEKLAYDPTYEIPKNDILLNRKSILGSGQFGVVYRGNLMVAGAFEVDKGEVAVKMPFSHCSKEAFKGMLSEVKLFCYMGSHENLVQFVGCYTAEIRKGIVWIVMELCPGGSLLNYLCCQSTAVEEVRGPVNFSTLVGFAKGIAAGMEYIASKNVIHGDLSARNVLLNEDLVCKIADFGLSRKLYNYKMYVQKNEQLLPWRWMALESLKKMEFSLKSDVWSYGVTIWEIFSLGDVPYGGMSITIEMVNEIEKGLRMTCPPKATEQIHDKMLACWQINPEERPDFTELVQYFASILPYDTICTDD